MLVSFLVYRYFFHFFHGLVDQWIEGLHLLLNNYWSSHSYLVLKSELLLFLLVFFSLLLYQIMAIISTTMKKNDEVFWCYISHDCSFDDQSIRHLKLNIILHITTISVSYWVGQVSNSFYAIESICFLIVIDKANPYVDVIFLRDDIL